MSNQDSRYDDLERTDVLPLLAQSDESARIDDKVTVAHPSPSTQLSAIPFGTAAHTDNSGGRISTVPAKPSPTDLAVGGIRGKIADLENLLIESQDRQISLKHEYDQLTRRYRLAEERVAKAETGYVQQSSDLHRVMQVAADAQQRLDEERVRLQAQIVDVERQLVDARTRGDKRAATLEQLLAGQTDRAAISERAAADARLELDRAQGELGVTKSAIRGLEERLAEQTQMVGEMTRLYSQQTSQVAANAALMSNIEIELGVAQTEKTAADARIAALDMELRNTVESVMALQSEIAVKLRHVAALEAGLEHRDRSVATLKDALSNRESSVDELLSAKASLDQRCAELENAAADAKATAVAADLEVARLKTALQGNDARINDLATALRAVERDLRERDAVITEATSRADLARQEHAQSVEQAEALRIKLNDSEQQLEVLRAQLAAKSTELSTTQESDRSSQTRHAKIEQEVHRLESELAEARGAMATVIVERNQLELDNESGRSELSRLQQGYEEAVQTIVASRESISVREQKITSLERDMRAATLRLEEAQLRVERAASMAEEFNAELRRRDSRIAALEHKCAEHESALLAINQDVERVNTANPNERLAAMGFALESLDHPGTVHRILRSTTTVGRAATNDVSIESTSVSRYHARIVVQPEGVWLIDMQSTNGCGVNGRRVSRQILCDGDAVMVGHCKFRFSALGAAKGERTQDEVFSLLDEPLLIPDTRSAGHDVSREQRH